MASSIIYTPKSRRVCLDNSEYLVAADAYTSRSPTVTELEVSPLSKNKLYYIPSGDLVFLVRYFQSYSLWITVTDSIFLNTFRLGWHAAVSSP